MHSQGIILRLQEDIKKVKAINKVDRSLNQIEFRGEGNNSSKGLRKVSAKLKARLKMSSIEEIVEVSEE